MMMHLALSLLAAAACGLAVALLTRPVRAWLIRMDVHDAPNARSSHSALKPRGGGLALLAVVLPAWLVAGWWVNGHAPLALVGLTAALAALSFVDDIRGLSAVPRLLGQLAAVVCGLIALDPEPLLARWLPIWLERGVLAVAWLWFVNLYNFMDGIDGITAVETRAIAFGLGLIALLTGHGVAGTAVPWLLAGASVGFLWWNWAPARIFLGDVGSVPLGFLLGWLLLQAAAAGQWAAALILPAYYLADATLTLLRRAVRLEKVWRAHREHAYQRAVHAGRGHAWVASWIAAVDAALLALAVWATSGAPILATGLAAVLVLGFWLGLQRGTPRADRRLEQDS